MSVPVSFTNAPLPLFGRFRHLPITPSFSSVGGVAVDASGVTVLPTTTLSDVDSSNGI